MCNRLVIFYAYHLLASNISHKAQTGSNFENLIAFVASPYDAGSKILIHPLPTPATSTPILEARQSHLCRLQ